MNFVEKSSRFRNEARDIHHSIGATIILYRVLVKYAPSAVQFEDMTVDRAFYSVFIKSHSELYSKETASLVDMSIFNLTCPVFYQYFLYINFSSVINSVNVICVSQQ